MPQITIDLSDEAYALLAQRAQQQGQSLEDYLARKEERFLGPYGAIRERLRPHVTSIKGFISTLLLDEDGTMFSLADRLEFYGIIDKECDRLRRLIDDLFNISQRKVGIFLEEIPLREFVARAILIDHGSTYKKPNHTLVYHIAEEVPETIQADQDKLEQILHGLVGYALKYSPDGGEVRLTVEMQDPETLLFAVADQGLGMTPEFLMTLSKKLEHADNRDTRFMGGKPPLRRVSELVEAHGGRLWPHSEGLGKGTTIFFTLPNPANHSQLPLPQDPDYLHALETVYRHCLSLVRFVEGLAERHRHYDAVARADLQRTLQTELEVLRRFVDTLDEALEMPR